MKKSRFTDSHIMDALKRVASCPDRVLPTDIAHTLVAHQGATRQL